MKKIPMIGAVLLVLPFLAFAGTLPDTGQTKCYDDSQEIPCPQPGEPLYGQDAQYAPCNPHSYTKLDASSNPLPDNAPWPWAMVRDNVTGLIWEVKTDDGSIHDKDNEYDWYDAQDVFITDLNTNSFGGYNEWRMPTIKELSTLVDSSIPFLWPSPTINTDYFPNTLSSLYWSSTAHAYGPSHAWYLYLGNGEVSSQGKSKYEAVRAVRGGQFSNNFIDNGDGTVTDLSTGLMWQKDTAPDTYKWQQALSHCETLTLADYDDWRLPNRNELQSLVDYSQYDPSIDTIFFPNTVSSAYWSSTADAGFPYYAWYFVLKGGTSYNLEKTDGKNVRAVRGGQCVGFGDSDGDGIPHDGDNSGTPGDNPCTGGETQNCDDNCPNIPNPEQINSDNDSLGDACDNCPKKSNENQADSDGDGIGNACEQVDTVAVPTLSEWGMIIFMTVILGLGVATLFRRRIE
jgi:hypothetical protein